MSITDELRKWAEDNTLRDRELTTCPPQHVVRGVLETLLRIADRIDAEHERLMRERRGCIHYDQERHYCNVHDLTTDDYKRVYDDGFASADDWLGQHESDMAEHGWVRLPLDADGVPIHFGDVLDQFGTPMTVFAMSDPDPDQGDCMLELITDGISDGTWVRARKMRHYYTPTVEDVLMELLDEAEHFHSLEEEREAIAEYAARLELREVGA